MKKDKNVVKDVIEWRDNNFFGMYRKGERERERERIKLIKERNNGCYIRGELKLSWC